MISFTKDRERPAPSDDLSYKESALQLQSILSCTRKWLGPTTYANTCSALQSKHNTHLNSIISSTTITDINQSTSIYPRMELSSHTNMALLRRDTFIFNDTQGKICNVQPFDPSISTRKNQL